MRQLSLQSPTNMDILHYTEQIPIKDSYDIIVTGGGLAGIAAAVSAKRQNKRVLLIEKSVNLGGLATNGLVNFFVPLCNGRGKQIIKGMAQELLNLAVKYGWNKIPSDWKSGEPSQTTMQRYTCMFSAPVFSLALTEFLANEGVEWLFDTIVSAPVLRNNHIEGLITDSKSGREFYKAAVFIDVTGDSDIIFRSGIPTVQGKNYLTYYGYAIDLNSINKAHKTKNTADVYRRMFGGNADLYGNNHPHGEKMYNGITNSEITQYIEKNQLLMLERLKGEQSDFLDIVQLPYMPQFRTTRRLDGDYTLSENDRFKHFNDSVGVICDFDNRDYLYEIPYRALVKAPFDNIITAGRSVSAEGYAWDVVRVIPPAIATGQAAGIAASLAIETQKPIYGIEINELQKRLLNAEVMIHFDDDAINCDDKK